MARPIPLDRNETIALKICLKEARIKEKKTLTHQVNGEFVKDFKAYINDEKIVDHIFPLLDPDLKKKKRIEAHAEWFKHINKSNTFLTADVNF